jgi:hypothetical protein
MLILGLLGMYFDAAVVFVTSQTLLFRLALAILCVTINDKSKVVIFVSFSQNLNFTVRTVNVCHK